MKKGRSTGTPTKEEEKLHRAIRDLGCICCWMVGIGPVPCAIHHLTVGGKHGQERRGHDSAHASGIGKKPSFAKSANALCDIALNKFGSTGSLSNALLL